MTSEPCLPEQPVAVVHIHGLADANIPFAGGVGPRARQRPPIDYVSVPATIERWRQLNGCPGEPETTQEGTVVRTASTGCAEGTSVVLYTVAGAGHAWPGGPPVTGSTRRVRDQPSDDLEASRVIWTFLDAHPRAQAPLTDGP
jgi:polyhydroxybutyrate depolymerase